MKKSQEKLEYILKWIMKILYINLWYAAEIELWIKFIVLKRRKIWNNDLP